MPERMRRENPVSDMLCPDDNGVASTVAKIEELCRLLKEGALEYTEFVHNVMETLGIHPDYYEEFLRMRELEALWE